MNCFLQIPNIFIAPRHSALERVIAWRKEPQPPLPSSLPPSHSLSLTQIPLVKVFINIHSVGDGSFMHPNRAATHLSILKRTSGTDQSEAERKLDQSSIGEEEEECGQDKGRRQDGQKQEGKAGAGICPS